MSVMYEQRSLLLCYLCYVIISVTVKRYYYRLFIVYEPQHDSSNRCARIPLNVCRTARILLNASRNAHIPLNAGTYTHVINTAYQ